MFISYNIIGKIDSKELHSNNWIPGENVIELPDSEFYKFDIEKNYVDIETKQVVSMPTKPSEFYDFDFIRKEWILNINHLKTHIINMRQTLLASSDWTDTVSAQSRLGTELYNQWQLYRQALRDIPQQDGYPENIIWPVPPGSD